MSQRDRIFLTPNWHVDCRLVAELPEDSVVGVRFITYVVLGLITVTTVIFTGYLAYTNFNLRGQIASWELRLEEDKWEVIEIKRLQRFYEIESKKIESAFSELKNPTMVSAFLAELGRTLPDRMIVNAIEWNDQRVVIRGGIAESSERASLILGNYVDKMRADPEIGPHFVSINLTGAERSSEDDQIMEYEITLRIKPKTK